jgi:hypothetical protein
MLKKPEVTAVTKVLAPQKVLGQVEDEVMADVEPPASTDPIPPPLPPFLHLLLPLHCDLVMPRFI